MITIDQAVESALHVARPRPMTISAIERAIECAVAADTFDVRDAVWRLIREGRAEFTPERRVRIKANG